MSAPYTMMIVKNEASRYLDSVLYWHSRRIPYFFIADDCSTDETFELCSLYSEHVLRRPNGVPSFLENEGLFRAWAWRAAGRHLEMNDGDWLLCLDADEFYVPLDGLETICEDAESVGADAVRFRRPEVWQEDGGELSVRIDGYWARTRDIRLARYQHNAEFKSGMGRGSVPAATGRVLDSNDNILHFGYLSYGDRVEKYDRYTTNPSIHNRGHINSILGRPELKLWEGVYPEWWRGLSESSLARLDRTSGTNAENS